MWHIQYLDQEIIKTFKTFYISDMKQRIIHSKDETLGTSSDNTKWILVLDVLHMMNIWNEVSITCLNNSKQAKISDYFKL